MPRKQRFKPSRKPKPVPQSESQAIGHEARNPAAHDFAQMQLGYRKTVVEVMPKEMLLN